MIKYDDSNFNPDSLSKNSIDYIQIRMIPPKSRVLEIGCATGFMSQYLTTKMQCQVVGIESGHDEAAMAQTRIGKIICGSIEDSLVQLQIGEEVSLNGPFDIVFASQVIEHILAPESVLQKTKSWLKHDGHIVVSTCNVAHWLNRVNLLFGNWEYTDYGLLDRNHVHFFTVQSLKHAIESAGFEIVESGFSIQDFTPFPRVPILNKATLGNFLKVIPFLGMRIRSEYIRLLSNLIAFQFVFKARNQL